MSFLIYTDLNVEKDGGNVGGGGGDDDNDT
jgi:hypothetical protein